MGLDGMTFEERQQLRRLVIERVTVDNGVTHIDTRIPGSASPGQLRLRDLERSEEPVTLATEDANGFFVDTLLRMTMREGNIVATQVVISNDVKAVLRQWYTDAVLDNTRALERSFLGWLFGLSGQHAVTINRTVHLTKNASAEGSPGRTVLIGHELFHVVQQHDMGWWPFLLGYLWHFRPTHLKRTKTHHYEVPAYDRGSEIRAVVGPG